MTRAIMAILAAALMAAMLIAALIDWSRGLPGTMAPQSTQRAALEPGQSVWQSMYMPVCLPERFEVQFVEPVTAPGALSIVWFTLENASRWPAVPVEETSLLLSPGDAHVTFAVPAASRVGGRLVGLRLTADRTAIVLPTTREHIVATGYATRKAGYLGLDDLVFRAIGYPHANDSGSGNEWLAALACVPRTQPAPLNQPVIFAGALIVACVTGAWLSALTARLRT